VRRFDKGEGEQHVEENGKGPRLMKWVDLIPAADCQGLPTTELCTWQAGRREFSWATYGVTSRVESEPFGELFSLGRKLRPLLSEARPAGCPLGPAKLCFATAARRVRRRRMRTAKRSFEKVRAQAGAWVREETDGPARRSRGAIPVPAASLLGSRTRGRNVLLHNPAIEFRRSIRGR
jgi:hypothetical protein